MFSPGVVAVDLKSCEDGWVKFQGHCYLHVTERKLWLDAEQYCRYENAHLASIITPEEQNFVNGQWLLWQECL